MRLARSDAQAASNQPPWVERRPVSCTLETPPRASIDRTRLLGAPIRLGERAWAWSRSPLGSPRPTRVGRTRTRGRTSTPISTARKAAIGEDLGLRHGGYEILHVAATT